MCEYESQEREENQRDSYIVRWCSCESLPKEVIFPLCLLNPLCPVVSLLVPGQLGNRDGAKSHIPRTLKA